MNDIDDNEQDGEHCEGVYTNGNAADQNTWEGQYCCMPLCHSSSEEWQER